MDSSPLNAPRKPCFTARLCLEMKRLALLAGVAALVLGAVKYYWYDRLDEQVRRHVEKVLLDRYPDLEITVKSARRIAGRGLEIRGIRVSEKGDRDAPPLVQVDEIFAECDTRLPDFLTKPVAVQAVHVQRLKVRAERNLAGAWNLTRLLPTQMSPNAALPPTTVSDGAIEIVDSSQGNRGSWMLRNIELAIERQTLQANGTPEKSGDDAAGVDSVLRLRGSLAGDHLERVDVDGTFDPQSGRWDVRGAVEGLEFSPRLRAALPQELGTALASLSSVRGRTYFGFHAEDGGGEATLAAREARNGFPFQFVVYGKISEGRIDDARLPEPLTDVEATIRCDNHGVLIQDLSARCGGTQLDLDASLAGYGSSGPMDIELKARQLQLERLPTATLPLPVRQTWDKFHPRGLADVSGRLRFDGQTWQPELTIECHDLTIVYDRFPYRLTDGSGTILVKPDSVFVRLRMGGGGQIVNCRADVRRPGPDFTGWIEVQSEGPVAIDEKLLAALDVPTQRLVRSFRPRGSAAVYARFQRDPGDARLHRNLQLALQDCSVQHERFPYPIDKVEGLLEQKNDGWTFRNLKGHNDSAAISGEGTWQSSGPDGRCLNLQFTATDVPLEDELRQALPPGPARLWSNLRPRGNIDQVVIGLKYTAEPAKWSVDVQAKKWPPRAAGEGRTITIEPPKFPYRLDNVTGSFQFHDGKIQFANLNATHGRASVSAEGFCQALPDGGHRVDLSRLSADHVDIDHELIAALFPAIGQPAARFPVEGPVNLHGAVTLVIPAEADSPLQTGWDVTVDIENGRVLTATPAEHLHGGMRLTGSRGAEGFFSRGELQLDSLMIRGVQLTDLRGPFWLDQNRLVYGTLAARDLRNAPRQLTARLFDGGLALDGELAFAGEGGFQVEAKLEDASLAEIARQVTPQQRGLLGRAFGVVKLSGAAAGRHTWRGNGQVRLRDADIYELPVMISLLKLLSIQRPDLTAFTTSNIDFRIEGDELALERIDFSGDAVSLKGTGRMNSSGEIDLKFHSLVGREERQLPLLGPLLGETSKEFLLIEAKGSLSHPVVRQTVFPRIDAQLQQLFPELAREEMQNPVSPLLSAPREALERLRLLPKR